MEDERVSLLDRKLKTCVAYGAILVVLFAIATYKATKDRVIMSLIATCFVTSVFLTILLLCDVMLRLCQTLISLTDMNQQSKETLWSIVSHNFPLNIVLMVVVIIDFLLLVVLMISIRRCPLNYVWDFGPYVCVPSMIFSFCLLRMIDLANWETNCETAGPLSTLSAMKGLDQGTGMAYSFYYGYLRVVLPSTGTTSKSILEKIENFEDNDNVTFPVHKLFILIPSSGYIPPNLKEASYQWMDNAHELEEEKRNRAGNIGRTYRNHAYKIYPGGIDSGVSPIYVVVEGASPLLTYYEVQRHNHPEAAVYEQYKREIIMMFYKKLQEVLESESDTRGLCELIYYDDYDSNGVKVNIAKIILDRISKIKNSI